MKNPLAQLALAALLGLVGPLIANAVVIEGTTPSGKFLTVQLTEDGRIPVEYSTGSVSHVIVDSGTITAYQGGVWNIQTEVGTTVTVEASTIATVTAGQVVVTGIAGPVLAANALRRQSVVCNSDITSGITVYLGPASVGTGTGLALLPGQCHSPDVPSSFVGTLFAVSTGAVTVSRIEYMKP